MVPGKYVMSCDQCLKNKLVTLVLLYYAKEPGEIRATPHESTYHNWLFPYV